jgi:hypothetical protein
MNVEQLLAVMVRVLVPEGGEVRRVTSKKGDAFSVQAVGIMGRDGLVQRTEIWHGAKDTPYAPGEYLVNPAGSIYVGRDGNIACRLKLIPAVAAARKAA